MVAIVWNSLSRLVKRHPMLVLAFAVSSVAYSASRGGILWFIKKYLDFLTLHATNSGVPGETYAFLALIGSLFILQALFEGSLTYCLCVLSEAIEGTALGEVVDSILSKNPLYFQEESPGELFNTIRVDIVYLKASVVSVGTMLSGTVTALAMLATACKIDFVATTIAIAPLLLILAVVPRISKELVRESKTVRGSAARLIDVVNQIIRGIQQIKVYNGGVVERKSFMLLANKLLGSQLKAGHLKNASTITLKSLGSLGIVLVLAYGGIQILHGTQTMSGLLTVILVLMSITPPLQTIYSGYVNLHQNYAHLKRLQDITRADCTKMPPVVSTNVCVSSIDRIELRDVSYAYPRSQRKALNQVSFAATRGKLLAIAGPSGSGKSTLAGLLLGFLKPESGIIRVGELDMDELALKDLWRSYAIVTQEPFIFNSNVVENVAYGQESVDEVKVIEALRKVALWKEISSLSQGIHTNLGIGGQDLSIGQKQRINIARAVYKGAQVLILDEATSALDPVSERAILHCIEIIKRDCVCLMITHKIETMGVADEVLFLRDGHVTESGKHAELLETSQDYRYYWAHQNVSAA